MADDRDPEEKFKAFEDALTEALHAVGSNTGRYRAHGYAKDVTSALRELLTPPRAPVAGQQPEPGDEFLRAHCECPSPKMSSAPDGAWQSGDDYYCTTCSGVVRSGAPNYWCWHTNREISSVLTDCYAAAYEHKRASEMQTALSRAINLLKKLEKR